MPILALDTATLVSSVAIAAQDQVYAELTLQTRLTHSEIIMPHIKQVLEMAKLEKTVIQAIAVSIGPGSFTGLRIGLATAKSMAYALGIPIVGVPTLAALAYHYPVPGFYLAPLLDAQKGNVYIALYEWENGLLKEVQVPTVEAFDMVLERGKSMDKPVVFLGEAAVRHTEKIKGAGKNILPAMPHMVMPRAANVAMLGLAMLQENKQDDVMQVEPLYIRRSEAEELWERRNGTLS